MNLTDDFKPTKFTFHAEGNNGVFLRTFNNKSEVWIGAVYEFVQFLKGMGYTISEDTIQIKDSMSDPEAPRYDTLLSAASRTW